MSSNRVTLKMVKQWLEESEFAQLFGFKITAYNDYYHIEDRNGNTVIWGETPKECWTQFCILRYGYSLSKNN